MEDDQDKDNKSNEMSVSVGKAEEVEEKKDDQNLNNIVGMNPVDLMQSACNDFLSEMSAADLKATSLYQNHLQRQQKLMNQFVADSLRLRHEHNQSLKPIHAILKKLKQPLEDILLS